MPDTESDPALTLETKFHAFVEGLTPGEVAVFNDLLDAWSDADLGDEVAGFEAQTPMSQQQAMQRLNQMFGLLGNLQNQQQNTANSIVRNLRG